MKVRIIKFNPMVSHDVGDIVEFEDAFAEKQIEAGFAEIPGAEEEGSVDNAGDKDPDKGKVNKPVENATVKAGQTADIKTK